MSFLTSPQASSAPARRRTLAALALAIGLALSACGGDDDAPAEREAYQPGSSSSSAPASSAPAEETSSAQPSSEPSEESSAPEEKPESSAPEEQPSPVTEDAPSEAQECVGSDYNFVELSGDIGCYDAKVAVEGVLNDGYPLGDGVSDGDVMCTPSGANWDCAQLGDTVYGITVQAKDLADDPLQDILDSSSDEDSDTADSAAITCSGAAYEFSDVRGMDCSEALAILDPFVDRRVPEGRSGGTQCSMEKVAGHEQWSCSRDSGGSFTAISR